MSSVSFREKNMLIIVGVIALYAFAALSYKKQSENWKIAKRAYQNAEKKYQEENALIAASKDWSEKYEQMRSLMPIFPYEKDVDTHWLNVMDSLAIKNSMTITRRQTNKENEVGDVYELPIECKDWEGSLESLVKFLYDLQKEGAMLDVRQVFIRPSARAGFLKGTFTLYCAYMRGAEQKESAAAATPAEEAKGEDTAEAPAPLTVGTTNETGAIVPAAVLPETTEPSETNTPTEATEQTK